LFNVDYNLKIKKIIETPEIWLEHAIWESLWSRGWSVWLSKHTIGDVRKSIQS